MLQTLKRHLTRDEDEGFTLIELMVVVLIIAILLAIAIPTFLGARERANDRAAQSSLRNAVTAAKTIFTDAQTFASADHTASGVYAVEPSLTYVASGTASDGHKKVSVGVVSATEWRGAAKSKSGKCFLIREQATAGTQFAELGSSASCVANAASVNWKDDF